MRGLVKSHLGSYFTNMARWQSPSGRLRVAADKVSGLQANPISPCLNGFKIWRGGRVVMQLTASQGASGE